jgi:hypothetical protein
MMFQRMSQHLMDSFMIINEENLVCGHGQSPIHSYSRRTDAGYFLTRVLLSYSQLSLKVTPLHQLRTTRLTFGSPVVGASFLGVLLCRTFPVGKLHDKLGLQGGDNKNHENSLENKLLPVVGSRSLKKRGYLASSPVTETTLI